ncbi:pyridoxamine 5'-phosphate oxidase family protein [Ketogulonicigenium robustum]|uniref:pyridoxamine 5'-phosphate oxidase family protein n=1 Tax=Ketogulonicigenium robustum TaxID=92947 RepID=UPI000A26BB0B|nr:pyridoxamine 5'-phosphate oxidase family protein [Ketogulonicigenium robustum]
MTSSITPRIVPAAPAGDQDFDSASYLRRIVREMRVCALATTDSQTGYPYLTSVNAAANRRGQVLFLTSLVAPHSRNMRKDPRLSIMCYVDESGESWAHGRPLTAGRVTLSGMAHVTDTPEDIEDFLSAHKKLSVAVKNGGFSIWKLSPQGVEMMGGPRLAPELRVEDLKISNLS